MKLWFIFKKVSAHNLFLFIHKLIEVKGDNKIDDVVVKAKANAAEEIASESRMKYIIYAGSTLMNENVLELDK